MEPMPYGLNAWQRLDGETRKRAYAVGAIVLLASIILLACSFDAVPPTQFGLLQNQLTGYVNTDRVYTPGLYFVFIGHAFIRFPRTRVTLQFSDNTIISGTDDFSPPSAPPIKARTGPDPSDISGESGGQPVDLFLSFQYRFDESQIPFGRCMRSEQRPNGGKTVP